MLACNYGGGFFAFIFLLALLSALAGGAALFGLLTVPAWLAVRRLMRVRFTAPLERGTLERLLVLVIALAAACTAVFCTDGIAAAMSRTSGGGTGFAQVLLVAVVPAPLGLVPWAAGELLGGESETPGLALMSSIGVTYVLSLAGLGLQGPHAVTTPAVTGQVATAAVAALGGGAMYLVMRGKAIPAAPPEAVALTRVLEEMRSVPGGESTRAR